MKSRAFPARVDYLAVGIASAAVLAYEIILLRVFSFTQWHHFASFAVALALLGFGAAGTLLTVLGPKARRWGDRLFLAGLLMGTVGMLLGYLLPGWITVRPLFAVWDASELGKLLLLDFISFIPFFGIGLSIGQVFLRWPEHTRILYGINLLGSGVGALLASLLLARVFLETALLLMPCLLLLSASLYAVFHKFHRGIQVGSLAGTLLLGIWIFAGAQPLPISDFKRLAYLLDLPDSRVVERQPGLQGEVTLVASDSIRSAPGLSLRWTEPVPATDALVIGSDHMIPLARTASQGQDRARFEASLASLPFQLRPAGRVALIGASEWLVPTMVPDREGLWIHPNRQVLDMFRERFLPAGMETRHADVRNGLKPELRDYSIIYLAGAYAGGDAATEDYLLTREAVRMMISRLDAGGLLAIPLPLYNPPRYAPKMLNLLREGAAEAGLEEVSSRVAFLRSLQEGLFILSKRPFTSEETRFIREFSSRWGFDMAALPGLPERETNQYQTLETPLFFQSAQAIFGGDAIPPEAAWYTAEAPRDHQPYFWRSMKWRNVPELIGQFGRQGLVWLDWSLLATVAKLGVALSLAAVLILAPLGRLPRCRKPLTRPRVWLYFTALGIGFLLLEIAVFQRGVLYLGDPVITAALVFSVFLVGAGLGSLTAPGARDKAAPMVIFPQILATAVFAFLILDLARDSVLGSPLWMRFAVLATAIAPLAWTLGQAFPWGLRQLDEDRALIPWAWGINGFASVLAPPLATLLSVHAGQLITWIAAMTAYGIAWLIARNWSKQWGWYG